MNYLIGADWHLGHRAMEKMCGRPADFEDQILNHLERTLLNFPAGRSETIFIHLGDVSLYKTGESWLDRALGIVKGYCRTALLVRGNHDPSVNKCYTRGWDFVCDEFHLKHAGKEVIFRHIPDVHDDEAVLIHGHQHATVHRGGHDNDGTKILIASEYLDYRPISLDTVLKLGRNPMWKDGKFQKLDRATIEHHRQFDVNHGHPAANVSEVL